MQLTLTGPVPTWATQHRRGHLLRPDPRLFGRWAGAVARRFGDRVDLWSIWNEPNHPGFLLPQYEGRKPVSPAHYRKLYLAAERALHRAPGGRHDVVLFGETAPVGNTNVVAPLEFLRGALCLDAHYRKASGCRKVRIDGYAHHAYTRRSGPMSRYGARDEVSMGTLHRLSRALDRAASAGAIDAARGIYLTEFGIQSAPDPISGVSLAQQAEYLAIAEHMAYVNPRVKAFSQYLLRDDAPRKGGGPFGRYAGFETGLRTFGGRKKPAYNGFILPLRATRFGSNDVLWGRVRPALSTVPVRIERRTQRGWKPIRALDTSPRGIFGLRATHRHGARYRVTWQRADGSTISGPPIRPYERTRPAAADS
jgi:hypothetical protein